MKYWDLLDGRRGNLQLEDRDELETSPSVIDVDVNSVLRTESKNRVHILGGLLI